MTPFLEYLKEDRIPSYTSEARRIVREASKYTLIGQHLYWRGFAFLLLRCVDGSVGPSPVQFPHSSSQSISALGILMAIAKGSSIAIPRNYAIATSSVGRD
ncbi:hypothetical protein CR513_30462, partial [Mucuna pruriens]